MSLKILFILPSLRRGGAETQLVALANSLSSQNIEVHVACFDEDIHQIDKLSSSIRFHHFPRTAKFDRQVIIKLSKLVEIEKIDVIHCTLQIALFYGWAAQLLTKRKPKLCLTIHGTANANKRADIFDWLLYQWLMRQCNALIFVCKTQQKYWENKWQFVKNKALTIYNGIDPAFFDREAQLLDADSFRKIHNIDPDAKIIAHVAGFRPEKGHVVLVKAFGRIAKSHPDSLIVFAGDGVLRPDIETMVYQEGLINQVRFIGNVSDVRPLLANAYIGVIPSLTEAFSIAMLEAMAMKIPLVATDVGGAKEAVIPDETGWLVEPANIQAFAQAIDLALKNEGIRNQMAESSNEKVLSNFTVEKMTKGYIDLFLNLQNLNYDIKDAADAAK